ncbi:MAG: PA0069 family radical SAM protein [Bacteroidota bacterium]
MYSLTIKGRGAGFNPPNRFDELHVGPPPEDIAQYFEEPDADRKIPTKYYLDNTKTILAENDSPDLGFRFSINPYRGCEHGCIYCYARPSHEYLGFSSGIDFETKILVKLHAAELLQGEFRKPSWLPQVVAFSGNTDCYQPVERQLEITRQCVRVFLEYRNPFGMITKNALIQRDLDLLKVLASLRLVCVTLSITTLDNHLARIMEPRTSAPHKRLETIELLANNGIPVGVNVAPIIPGLNDVEIPSILKAATEHGAKFAGHTIVRLSYALKELFVDWVQRHLPEKAPKIINRIREVRGGKLSSSEFGTRMTGEGELAESIHQLFASSCKRLHLNEEHLRLSTAHFTRTPSQLKLFS